MMAASDVSWWPSNTAAMEKQEYSNRLATRRGEEKIEGQREDRKRDINCSRLLSAI